MKDANHNTLRYVQLIPEYPDVLQYPSYLQVISSKGCGPF